MYPFVWARCACYVWPVAIPVPDNVTCGRCREFLEPALAPEDGRAGPRPGHNRIS